MGTSSLSRCAIVATFTFAFHFCAAGQGSLTPPGAPAATMKSLDQVEARTAITNTATLVTISQPGSYYLTHNLNVTSGDAIDINTNQVTLDLNGFTISTSAAGASGNAVYLTRGGGNLDITILNGHIKGSITNNNGVFSGAGFANGIYYNEVGTPYHVRVSGVSVSGCLSNGILAGLNNGSVVEACTVRLIGHLGIAADTVSHSTAFDCGDSGILGAAVSDCSATELSPNGYAIQAVSANNCAGTSNGTNGTGIYAGSASGCSGTSNRDGGIGLIASTANNCTGYNYGIGGTGLSATVANNCFGNDFSGGGGGIALNAQSANNCYGSSGIGTGIKANIANSCIISGGTTNIIHKYNMP